MSVYFPTAGIEASPLLLPLMAFAISFFTSMGGVSGAFLLLPFQVSVLGFTSPAVSPTNQVFNIFAIPAGLGRFSREGRMVWPLALAVVAGTVPGVLLGAFIRVRYLPDPGRFKVFVGFVLLFIAGRMAFDLILRRRRGGRAGKTAGNVIDSGSEIADPSEVVIHSAGLARIDFEFLGRRYWCSTPGIIALSLAVGVVSGAYGIGGGSIMAPFFVAVLGLPVHAVAGAALAGTLATSIAGVVFYQAIAPFFPDLAVAPDWGLGALFGLGGVAGIWLGARCQRHVPERAIKVMLAAIALLVALKYVGGWLFA